MFLKNFFRKILNFNIFLGLVSGPIVSTLLMLLPLGVLIGLFEVIDPAFVAYEYVPEEILFIPWILIMLFISFVNTRAAYLLNNFDNNSAAYMIQTDKFYTPSEKRIDHDEFPGKIICCAFKTFLTTVLPDLSCSEPYHKDYGWSFLVDKDENSLIETTFAFAGIDDLNPHIEIYEITIDYSPPLNPFYLASFSPNAICFNQINDALKDFMEAHEIAPSEN